MVLGGAAYGTASGASTGTLRDKSFTGRAALSGLRASRSRSGSSNHSSSAVSGKSMDDSSFYGSVLDQLHAEQKSTIEALTCQVEFYRQREERFKKELDTLQQCLPSGGNNSNNSEEAVARLARENRELGDVIDGLRSKQTRWEADRARLERHKLDLERQLKDARHTLMGFSQAVEQLEVKMQRKEAEVQARCLELEQQLREKTQECARLAEENALAEQRVQNLQTASDENERLRRELQSLTHQDTSRSTDSVPAPSQFTSEIQRVRDMLQSQDKTIADLGQKVATSAADLAAAHLDVERKRNEIKELQLQLDNASNLMTVREQLLSTDDSTRKHVEAQRQELLSLVSGLQREKTELQDKLGSLQSDLASAREDLQTARTRLNSKDHAVMVSTLRSEISSLKDRLRGEFRQENDDLQQAKQTLSQEISLLHTRLGEKDQQIRDLQHQMTKAAGKQRQFEYDERQWREQIASLEGELEQARSKYQQLQNARTALADQLDFGFKELLDNDDSAASAREEAAAVRLELNELKQKYQHIQVEHRATIEELESARRQHDDVASRLNDRIDDLYRQLIEKDDAAVSVKNMERRLELAEEEKAMWDGQVTDMRLRGERRLEIEVRKVEELRTKMESLREEKVAKASQIAQLELAAAQMNERIQELEDIVREKDGALDVERGNLTSLSSKMTDLRAELQRAVEEADIARNDKSSREKRLVRERKQLESEVVKLVERIEQVGKRNLELGDKVVALVKQAKADETSLVALSTQVKSYKRHTKQLEGQLGNAVRSHNVRDLSVKVNEVTCLNESYKLQVSNLQTSLENVQRKLKEAYEQRDEAVKSLRTLSQCQEQMKVTVENHTADLVEEIEALQHQLESERERCALLLSNEKTLLRDLQERNAAISKLQHSISAGRVRPREGESSRHHSGNRRSNSSSSSISSAFASATNARERSNPSPTASSGSTLLAEDGTGLRSSSEQPASIGEASRELDRLLHSLEHISELSTQPLPSLIQLE